MADMSLSRDHPRVCGEHAISTKSTLGTTGSSPRVRGTRHQRHADRQRVGIIPACAGNTTGAYMFHVPCRDHPRVCGEHRHSSADPCTGAGSSPRVRGTPNATCWIGYPTGIIPACAGNTQYKSLISETNGDHPRVCGEHLPDTITTSKPKGSSPRVRGTPPLRCLRVSLYGIIPACAGNTAWPAVSRGDSWDHPRVCGEHGQPGGHQGGQLGSSPRVRGTQDAARLRPAPSGIIPACAGNTGLQMPRDHFGSGSSPRVRGTPPVDRVCVSGHGIIPACAGNTICPAFSYHSARDHPRVCGEHRGSFMVCSFRWGSSPRVRGTPRTLIARSVRRGIIPACAGNTAELRSFVFPLKDHPRVCGEHYIGRIDTFMERGSSPRVRGTLRLRQRRHYRHGIIPACAGNTNG